MSRASSRTVSRANQDQNPHGYQPLLCVCVDEPKDEPKVDESPVRYIKATILWPRWIGYCCSWGKWHGLEECPRLGLLVRLELRLQPGPPQVLQLEEGDLVEDDEARDPTACILGRRLLFKSAGGTNKSEPAMERTIELQEGEDLVGFRYDEAGLACKSSCRQSGLTGRHAVV